MDVPHDLSVCLNPIGSPPEVSRWWKKPQAVWQRYPRPYAEEACAALSKSLGCNVDNVLLGNGCGELFALALRALHMPCAAVVRPCYGGYAESARLMGVPMRMLDLSASLWSKKEVSASEWETALCKEVEKLGEDFSGALFLANPNNPDGRLLTAKGVADIAAAIPNGWLFLDHSYMDFLVLPGCENPWRASFSDLPLNVLVFQSFTKFFCMAGTRLAAVYGPAKAMARLKILHLPWTVNGAAQAIAPLLYQDKNWLDDALVCWRRQLAIQADIWEGRGVKLCKRDVPWLWGSLDEPAAIFAARMRQEGIAVRVFQDDIPGIGSQVRIGLPAWRGENA